MDVDVQQGANNEVAEKCVAFFINKKYFIRFRLRCNICCFFFSEIFPSKYLWMKNRMLMMKLKTGL